jgi:multisubunit Na+/H+ antiporter MnhG subunit
VVILRHGVVVIDMDGNCVGAAIGMIAVIFVISLFMIAFVICVITLICVIVIPVICMALARDVAQYAGEVYEGNARAEDG